MSRHLLDPYENVRRRYVLAKVAVIELATVEDVRVSRWGNLIMAKKKKLVLGEPHAWRSRNLPCAKCGSHLQEQLIISKNKSKMK